MPELPEIETVRLAVERLALGRTIAYYKVMRADYFQQGAEFASKLKGAKITAVVRRGKFLSIVLDRGYVLMHHLGMSGRFLHVPTKTPIETHTHLRIGLDDGGSEFRQRDPRRFGFAAIFQPGQLEMFDSWSCLGPDALEIRLNIFQKILHGRTAPIKNVLLNQRRIAGLGNIYVDEGLFRANILPTRRAGDVSETESKLLLRSLKQVLKESIRAGGSTTNDFQQLDGRFGEFQHAHRVYGRQGQPCLNCRKEIHKVVLGGRGTHFCPSCQK
ncbi:MAG: bifunctional DNA-formamidopyrimidine glycosylase/DNA-(apurinic or apyrimidinic site) lyase [Candidatus Hinthialibacter antarcticus]|nr:bifunctional DNA-formamidopyrimidine glycosylase/DNA-(apurinic or apyrimidinic site) lyase [Candidatus Hinthialibacter antarcticus]